MEGLECEAKPGRRQDRCAWVAVTWSWLQHVWVGRRRGRHGSAEGGWTRVSITGLCLFFVPLVVGTTGGGF